MNEWEVCPDCGGTEFNVKTTYSFVSYTCKKCGNFRSYY